MRRMGIARTVLLGQGLVALGSSVFWGLARDPYAGMAALAGGGIAIIPGVYMAVCVFSVPPDAEPRKFLGAFYRGEVVKFALTAGLFLLAVPVFASTFLPLIVTYILALLVYWFALSASATTQR